MENETVWAVTQWIIDDYSIDESVRNFVAEKRMKLQVADGSKIATKDSVMKALSSVADEFTMLIDVEKAVDKVLLCR